MAAGTSLADTCESVRGSPPRVVVIDKVFGIPAVIDWVRSLSRGRPRTAIVVWGTTMSEVEALHFLQAGARGVVRKTASLDALLECVVAVAAGNTWVEEQVSPAGSCGTAGALAAHRPRVPGHGTGGTRVEEPADIAGTLGICTGTVKIHLKHIFEKPGIRGRYGLALSGLKEKGLLAASALDAA